MSAKDGANRIILGAAPYKSTQPAFTDQSQPGQFDDAPFEGENKQTGEDGVYDDEDYYDDGYYDEEFSSSQTGYSASGAKQVKSAMLVDRDFGITGGATYQSREHDIAKKVTFTYSQGAANDRAKAEKKAAGTNRKVGRDDRATIEQVMDPRTRLILFKLLSRNILSELNGCISTGKEANVYHALGGEGEHLAVKVFKTSILVFKDRDKYMSGEHRFRNGYCRSNPRKMVKQWAEKEMRNLKRVRAAGIPCPKPILLKMHVLVMEFIGKRGWPAPRLKDAKLSQSKLRSCYVQCVKIMRRMYQLTKLVHGDLSEYNMLWQNGTLYVIDVSQSVEHDHPRSLEFLRMDCRNVTAFFKNSGLTPMSPTQLFRFIVDEANPECNDEQMDSDLDNIQKQVENQAPATVEEEIAENVFMQSFIPRSLSQVPNHEEEERKLAGNSRKDEDKKLLHMFTGRAEIQLPESVDSKLKIRTSASDNKIEVVLSKSENLNSENAEENSIGSFEGSIEQDFSESDVSCEEDEDTWVEKKSKHFNDVAGDSGFRLKDADKLTKKEHKKIIKEAKREKRKKKIPKHIKKQHMKKGNQSSKRR
mmetsp:Transcript_1219/g.1761  ORF Transcript_1219/g.1761 Transcript_1219/m.1761 type:complete len:588 (-) Transcript_1219:2456-4219(-)